MSDTVLVALITASGSVAVAFITVYFNNKPKHDKDAELEKELLELKKELKEYEKNEKRD